MTDDDDIDVVKYRLAGDAPNAEARSIPIGEALVLRCLFVIGPNELPYANLREINRLLDAGLISTDSGVRLLTDKGHEIAEALPFAD